MKKILLLIMIVITGILAAQNAVVENLPIPASSFNHYLEYIVEGSNKHIANGSKVWVREHFNLSGHRTALSIYFLNLFYNPDLEFEYSKKEFDNVQLGIKQLKQSYFLDISQMANFNNSFKYGGITWGYFKKDVSVDWYIKFDNQKITFNSIDDMNEWFAKINEEVNKIQKIHAHMDVKSTEEK